MTSPLQLDPLLTFHRNAVADALATLEMRISVQVQGQSADSAGANHAKACLAALEEVKTRISAAFDAIATAATPVPTPVRAAAPAASQTQTQTGPRKAFSPTDEQSAVIEGRERCLVVNAFAGSGKTSMLQGFAAARPRERFLYLAYNKPIAVEAQQRFGANSNVQAKTSHSLAFAAVGHKYSAKFGNPKAWHVMELLRETGAAPQLSDVDEYLFAQIVLRRVTDFFAEGSLDPEMGEANTPAHATLPSGLRVERAEILKAARAVWTAMKDVNHSFPMAHDGYLKLFQLMQPNLSRFSGLLLDEAQDTTPALLHLLVAQKNATKVFVGDEHQNIFSYRGSVNAMDKISGATRYALTKSFRFGPKVAYVANLLLAMFCGEDKRIVGLGGGQQSQRPTSAQLYRTNAGLFGAAVGWLGRSEVKKGLCFVGGVDNYQFDLITDTWHLKAGLNGLIRDALLRKFSSFEEFERYVETVDDRELVARLKIVEEFGSAVPQLVAEVKAAHVEPAEAVVFMATAHRSKGLEWDFVTLGNDFPDLVGDNGMPRAERYLSTLDRDTSLEAKLLPREEANLFYVATTRAREQLHPNGQLMAFLDWCDAQRAERRARTGAVGAVAGAAAAA